MGAGAFGAGGDFFGPDVKALADANKGAFALQCVKRAAPDDYHVPAVLQPLSFIALVSPYVLAPLLHPERDIALGHRGVGASVPVPEASAHVYYRLRPSNHNVRLTDKAPVAYPISPAGGKNPLAHDKLRLRVLATNAAHYVASLLFRYPVHVQFHLNFTGGPRDIWHKVDTCGRACH